MAIEKMNKMGFTTENIHLRISVATDLKQLSKMSTVPPQCSV